MMIDDFRGNRSHNKEARLRHIEDSLARVVSRLRDQAEAAAGNVLGGGSASLPSPPPPSGTLSGDVIGPLGANTVVGIQNVDVNAPVSPTDDLKFLQYDDAGGMLRWESVFSTPAPFRTITTSGAATTADANGYIFVDTTAGPVTVTLPAAVTMTGLGFTVKKISTDMNEVILDGAGVETIDDLLLFPYDTPYTAIKVISDGVEWWVV